MSHRNRIALFVLVIAGSGVIATIVRVWLTPETDSREALSRPTTAPAAVRSGVGIPVSSAGCFAAACHGRPDAPSLASGVNVTSWTHSATCWLSRDPHRGAHEVLNSPIAGRIMNRLRAADPSGWAAKPVDEPRCLACHTNPALARPDRHRGRAVIAEGVSCEACHGNASGWLYEHTTWTTGERVVAYPDRGMTRLYDLGERAATCAGCHVGAPADPCNGVPVRDMNHDMIAAGHPRLAFDFAEQQRRLPPHWLEKDRTAEGAPLRGAEFDASAWLIGRVAVAEAACRLLADRAGRDAMSSWPEFAEFSCSSCHRELTPDGGRVTRPGMSTRAAGAPSWQTIWPVTHPTHLTALSEVRSLQPAVAAAIREFGRVRDVMESPGPPRVQAVRDSATAAAKALGELRERIVVLPARDATRAAREIFRLVQADELSRDDARQVYHGLAALERTRLRLSPLEPDESLAFDRAFNALSQRRSGSTGLPGAPLRELLEKVPPRLEAALK